MRNCPACSCVSRDMVIESYDDPRFSLYHCGDCGMLYVDGRILFPALDQAWFDDYYLNVYSIGDGDLSDSRLESLADVIQGYSVNPLLDIGGEDGKLREDLRLRGVACDVAGVQYKTGLKYKGIVLSHVLEHIYDIPAMMTWIRSCLDSGGLLFIECPLWTDKSLSDPAHYDWHFQHVNKFTLPILKKIVRQNGFSEIIQCSQIEDYLEYNCCRVVARLDS